jgi:hypothetical protein
VQANSRNGPSEEAFGRAVSYDTNGDGVVRIRASEVRRRLGLYYAAAGKDSAIKDSAMKIDLPVGGYAPKFSCIVTETERGEAEQARSSSLKLASVESHATATPRWSRKFRTHLTGSNGN